MAVIEKRQVKRPRVGEGDALSRDVQFNRDVYNATRIAFSRHDPAAAAQTKREGVKSPFASDLDNPGSDYEKYDIVVPKERASDFQRFFGKSVPAKTVDGGVMFTLQGKGALRSLGIAAQQNIGVLNQNRRNLRKAAPTRERVRGATASRAARTRTGGTSTLLTGSAGSSNGGGQKRTLLGG